METFEGFRQPPRSRRSFTTPDDERATIHYVRIFILFERELENKLYFSPIVIFNVAAAVVNLIPSIPSPYRVLFVVVNVAIQSAMSSRIHRHIKLGLTTEHPMTKPTLNTVQTVRFAANSRIASHTINLESQSVQSTSFGLETTGSAAAKDEKVEGLDLVTEEKGDGSGVAPPADSNV